MADDEPTDAPEKGAPEPKPKPDPSAEDIERMQAALKKANKEAEQSRLRLKELEDKDKSESDKLAGRVAELEKELAGANSRAMRLDVALDKGLTKTQARRLVGDTEDDLITDADELLASFKTDEPKPDAGSRPKETLRPGAAPTEPEPTKEDLRKVIDQIPR